MSHVLLTDASMLQAADNQVQDKIIYEPGVKYDGIYLLICEQYISLEYLNY